MLGILIKKELMEVFKSYFYNAKTNTARRRWVTILCFVFFAVLILGCAAGLFTVMGIGLYFLMKDSDQMWMYYTLFGLLALVIGVFGSVISTYARLYKANDNELLLSMPIPVRNILLARLLTASLINFLYSGIAFLPGFIVRLAFDGFIPSVFLGGLIQFVQILLIGLVLTCLISWFAAKVSGILKYKALVRAVLLLVVFGIYMLFCIKFGDFLENFITKVFFYGQKIREVIYPLYVWGCVGDGYREPILVTTALVLALSLIAYRILKADFIKLVTGTEVLSRAKYKEGKTLKSRSLSAALLMKESKRFTYSANYMLNCGMGTLMLVLMGLVVLFRGKYIFMMLPKMMGDRKNILSVLAALLVCGIAGMNDMAVPSVSLEGSSLWILKSLPIPPWEILKAKLRFQLILTMPEVLFCCLCVRYRLEMGAAETVLFLLVPLGYVVMMALFDLFIGIRRPNLTWKNEIVPIKQSFAVLIGVVGGMLMLLIPVIVILLWGYHLNRIFLLTLLFMAECIGMYRLSRYLRTKGTEVFERLL